METKPETTTHSCRYDDILEAIGEFGWYQKVVYFILCLPATVKGIVVMGMVFMMSLPAHRCALPDYANDTYGIQNPYHQRLINETIPTTRPDGEGSSYAQSTFYDLRNQTEPQRPSNVSMHGIEKSCDRWVYQQSRLFFSSISTEYDIVCSHRVLRSHINMGFFAGSMLGSLVFGVLADIVGRKTSLLLCVSLQTVCGVGLYLVTSFYGVIILRAIQGMTITMFAISAAAGMELVGPSKRTFAGVMVEVIWSLGVFLVPLLSYLTSGWRLYQLIGSLLSLLVLVAIFFVPESPRWLLDKGKTEKAEKILVRISRSNKKPWPKEMIHHSYDKGATEGVNKLFRDKSILVQSLIVIFNWFAVNFLYYGLSLSLDNLSGSLYVNYTLSSAVELVAFFLCFGFLRYWGRRTCYVTVMVLGGLACLTSILPFFFGKGADAWSIILLAMIVKLAASSAYTIIYIMTVELFPTTTRNSMLGVCSVSENLGGVVSPYIADLGNLVGGPLHEALPMLVFGTVSLLAGLMSLALPETKDKPLPETIEDILFHKEKKTSSSL